MNNVVVSGRLGKDPELRYTQSGKAVTNISIAIEDEFKKDEGVPTTWMEVQFWEQNAEFLCSNAGKGDKIFVRGQLRVDSWDENGAKRYKTYILCQRLEMLPKSAKNEQKQASYDYGDGMASGNIPGPAKMPSEMYESDDEELPF